MRRMGQKTGMFKNGRNVQNIEMRRATLERNQNDFSGNARMNGRKSSSSEFDSGRSDSSPSGSILGLKNNINWFNR